MLLCVCVSHTVMSNSGNPWTGALSGSFVHRILQARILEWVAIFSSGNHQCPEIELGSPELQADSLPYEPPYRGYNMLLNVMM